MPKESVHRGSYVRNTDSLCLFAIKRIFCLPPSSNETADAFFFIYRDEVDISRHCSRDATRNNRQKMYLVSRTETFAKLFFIVSFTGLFMYVALAFYSFHTAYTTVSQTAKYQERFNDTKSYEDDRFEKDLKYILVWAKYHPVRKNVTLLPSEGQTLFIENNCPEINCYITANESILNNDYMNFDAIVFNMTLMSKYGYFHRLPTNRTKRQKYVFYGMQAADSHPICNIRADNFFNWTWTYKFYSDVFSPFIEVKDWNGKVVAPSRKVLWTTHLKPHTDSDVRIVYRKTKAIAWVLEDCKHAEKVKKTFVPKLSRALKAFNLTIDVYGCGNRKCPLEGCLKAIERDYYFYLAAEVSMSEYYVTAEVLKGYHHDAVPVVVGGADYTK